MLIHVAENGKSFELGCQPGTIVDIVQNTLAPLTCIPVQDQMLICEGVRLEPSRPLEFYKLPSDDKKVFLFNRARLLPDAPPPPPEDLDVQELEVVSGPLDYTAEHPLDQAQDLLLRTLPQYERKFRKHLQDGQAIWRRSEYNITECRRLLQEQQVQELAIATARANMDVHYVHICNSFDEFMSQCSRKLKIHTDLLDNFDRDLVRLKLCELLPSLQTETRRTLLDCIPEAALRKWFEDCKLSHRQFSGKVLELKNLFKELKGRVEQLVTSIADVDTHKLELGLEDSQQLIVEQTTILQSLSKDLSTVRKLVEDAVSPASLVPGSTSMRPLDAVTALAPMDELHTKYHIPKVEACGKELQQLVVYFLQYKNTMSRCVHTQLQTVAALQSKIRDMRNQLAGYKEALAYQEYMFSELVLARRVGPAYKACLAEVLKRRSFVKFYTGQARHLAERMAAIRETEVARREKFLQHQKSYMPEDVLESMGLLGLPSQCDVSVPTFDTDLINVEISDLQGIRGDGVSSPLGLADGGSRRSSFQGDPRAAESSSASGSDRSLRRSDSEIRGDARGDALAVGSAAGSMMMRQSELGGGETSLDMENAWLKAELASTIAVLCAFQQSAATPGEGAGETPVPQKHLADRMAEAIRLKDEHSRKLETLLSQQQTQCSVYEDRIRELEAALTSQHNRNLKDSERGGLEVSASEKQPSGPASSDEVVTRALEGLSDDALKSPTGLASGVSGGDEEKHGASESKGDSQAAADVELSRQVEAGTSAVVSSENREASLERDAAAGASSSSAQVPAGPSQSTAGAQGRASQEVGGLRTSPLDLEASLDASSMKGAEGLSYSLGPTAVFGMGVSTVPYRKGFRHGGPGIAGILAGEESARGGGAGRGLGKELDRSPREFAGTSEGRDVPSAELQGASSTERRCKVCFAAEEKLKGALARIAELRTELERNKESLNQCKASCAMLETQLREAKEAARTHLVSAERYSNDYKTLRHSSVRLHGLLERLNRCLVPSSSSSSSLSSSSASSTAAGGTFDAAFLDMLRALAATAVGAESGETGAEGVSAFRSAVSALVERVEVLLAHRMELLSKCSAAEGELAVLKQQQQQQQQQAMPDPPPPPQLKVSEQPRDLSGSGPQLTFSSFKLGDVAVFVRNSKGHYEAVSLDCPNVFLAPSSLEALLPKATKDKEEGEEEVEEQSKPLVGKIVQLARQVVGEPATTIGGGTIPGGRGDPVSDVGASSCEDIDNPYDLRSGTEYSVADVVLQPWTMAESEWLQLSDRRKRGDV